jgi:hypothetical protein
MELARGNPVLALDAIRRARELVEPKASLDRELDELAEWAADAM